MLNKQTLFIFAVLAAVISAHNLAFDLRGIKYTQASDFWTVDVPCTGGSGQYSYEYDLPSGWKTENNRIKIPTTSTRQVDNQYVVRCRVRDSSKGDLLERSLVFKPFSQGSSYSLEVTDHDYFYGNSGLSAYSESGSSIHGIDVLNRLGALVQGGNFLNLNLGGFSAGSGYSSSGSGYASGSGSSGSGYSGNGGYSGSSSSGYSGSSSYGSQSSSSYSSSSSSGYSSSSSSSSSYSSLPSISQLEKYIYGGDIVEIIQTIQLVVDSKIKCDAKAAYLSDFLGRICAAIEVKKFALKDLKAIVATAVAQVQKLTVQIQAIKGQQANLRIDELKKQLDTLVSQLKVAYDEYNNFNSNYSSYEAEISTLEREINETNNQYQDSQQRLDQLRRTSQSIDQEISEYEEKIKRLKEKKSSVQKDIVEAQNFVRQKDQRIKEIREKITILKTKISNISTQKDKLKQAYLELEKKVSIAKEAYETANAKYSEYERQIVSITVEIERYQKQTSELEVKQLNQCVENLESAITEIKESIDFVHYHCWDASDVEIDHDDNTRPCYHFGRNQWFGYVNKCYSGLADQIRNKIAESFRNQVIEITTINVFSDAWKNSYGSCFQKDIESRAQNYKSDKSFGFDNDFSCSGEFGNVETKSGVIQNISSSNINVRGDDGRDYTLKLGSCSKFEGQGKDFVPRKGHNIFWKGSNKSGYYNLHSCTCY